MVRHVSVQEKTYQHREREPSKTLKRPYFDAIFVNLTIQIFTLQVAFLFQAYRSYQALADGVRVAVTTRPPVLEVAKTLCFDWSRNSYTGTAVGDAVGEFFKGCGFAGTGEALTVRFAAVVVVVVDVVKVAFGKSLAGFGDVLHAAGHAHWGCGEVAVAAGTVPVAFHGFRVQ